MIEEQQHLADQSNSNIVFSTNVSKQNRYLLVSRSDNSHVHFKDTARSLAWVWSNFAWISAFWELASDQLILIL
jgi:hypothetical protein